MLSPWLNQVNSAGHNVTSATEMMETVKVYLNSEERQQQQKKEQRAAGKGGKVGSGSDSVNATLSDDPAGSSDRLGVVWQAVALPLWPPLSLFGDSVVKGRVTFPSYKAMNMLVVDRLMAAVGLMLVLVMMMAPITLW
jgi:hypothetical protein